MIKKVLFGLSAILALFATSCQNDLDSAVNAGKTSAVSFSVATPEMATRAYSDGTTATVLQYAVYDAEGVHLPDLNGITTINMSTTIDLQLTTGDSYTILFWAAAENAPYEFDPASKIVTVDYTNAICNDEKRDAFFARHDFRVNGAQTENVYLKRPFAQLNIATNDYAASKSAGYEPTLSAVTVKNIYSTLNLFDGSVGGAGEVTYDYSAIPTEETFPIAGYDYLSMNYLLVAKDKEVIEVEFGYKEEATEAKTRIVGSVPVQRNYRTNIFGQLLTSFVGINVMIVPDYDGYYNYPSNDTERLILAATLGGEITLTEDVVLNQPLIFTKNVRLNLNGYTITGGKEYTSGISGAEMSVLTVDENAVLTIFGEGRIIGAGYGLYAYNGTLNINDATVEAPITAVQVYIGTANIESGYYRITDTEKGRVINNIDGYYTPGKSINITGGTFEKFNPANNDSEGAGTNFLPEGYSSIADGDNFVVVKGTAVADATELEAALSGNAIDPIIFTNSIENVGTGFAVERDVVFNMNNYEFNAGSDENSTWYAIQAKGDYDVVINDANFTRAGISASEGANVVFNSGIIKHSPERTSRYIFSAKNEGTTITINGGTFTNDRAKNSFFWADSGAVIYVKGGNFGGVASNKKVFLTNGGQVIITGGTFNFDPTEWVAEGYEAVKSGSTWTVSAIN